MTLRDLAQTAINLGISVVPAAMDGTKRPIGEWKQYQRRPATSAELDRWFGDSQEGIGVICGRVSGGLEMLEFEGRAIEDGTYGRFQEAILAGGLADLWRRITDGYQETTPSGGLHIFYRCERIEGNRKLARRRTEDGIRPLIETRGEGGFVVIAPTSGACHPTGRPWVRNKGSLETIVTISPDERAAIFTVAAGFDDNTPNVGLSETNQHADRPGDRYNAAPDIIRRTFEILKDHGWTVHHLDPDGTIYLTRPGKDDGVSATLGHPKTGGEGFYVFTTSSEFEAEHSYSPFQVLTILQHGGDYTAAARALAAVERAAEPQYQVVVGSSDNPEPDIDLDAFLNLPEPEYDWLVEGLIERGDRIIITGSEGAGKSTLLRQAAVTIGAGIHPFTGGEIEPRRVLYIDLENSRRHVRRQLRPLRIVAGDRLQAGNVTPIIRPEGIDLLTTEDQTWLRQRVEANRPDVLIIGPTYKLAGGDPSEEQPAKVVATLLDHLRTEHGFAVLMEAHSPHGETGKKRPKRPYGASLWLRWPEFGLHIDDNGNLTHWRGARDERAWPSLLKRGGAWPWTLAVNPVDVTWDKILAFCDTQIFRPSIRQIEAGTMESKSSIQRILAARKNEWIARYPEEPI